MQLEYFDGFPYILTRAAPSVYHIALLPADLGFGGLKEVTRWQVAANKLDSCLVLGPDACIYFAAGRPELESAEPPRGGFNFAGLLRLCRPFQVTEDACRRLQAYLDQHGPRGYLFGDLSKGGRYASRDELRRLARSQPNGIPVGLEKCARCGDWHGECLDPSIEFACMVMRVSCRCENDTLCAGCGQPLADRKVAANFYSESEHLVWHVPGIAAFSHQCGTQELTHG